MIAHWRLGTALLACALAACGGGGDGGPGTSTTPTSADVEVAIAASAATVAEGDSVTYTATVRSVGAETARDVVVALDLGSGQSLAGLSCSASGGGACPAQLGLQMSVPVLPPGAQLVFNAPVTLALGTPPGGVSATLSARAAADARPGNNAATASVSTIERSWVRLQSNAGDPVGGGLAYAYTKANAQLTMAASGGLLTVTVTGDQFWIGQFQLPNSLTQFQVGTFASLTRYPLHAPAVGGMNWSGSNACGQLRGTFTVTRAIYAAGALSELDLSFEQTCEPVSGSLRGALRWRSADATQPPGPVNPPPASLWQPPAGATPDSGDYVYLQADPGAFGGGTYLYTRANAALTIAMSGSMLQVAVAGNELWNGRFRPMNSVSVLEPGYYPNLQYPDINPTRGSLDWTGNSQGCSQSQGWVVVDRVGFVGGQLRELELRFEYRCGGATGALRGKVRLTSNDPTQPPGPVQPPPAGLWAPPAGAVPATGDFIYLQSDAGDYIGAGRIYSYSRANARLMFSSGAGRLAVSVDGDEWWNGDFQAMSTLTRFVPGYYGDLQRFPFHNSVKGGLSWAGEGRGCNRLSGWFVVDSVSYNGDVLTAITLRFEQRCESGTAALRGLVRLTPGDATAPPGPVEPPPAGLWAPAAGSTPASGDYVYLESDNGDYIGVGATYTYTRANAQLLFSAVGAEFSATVNGDQSWRGDFAAMDGVGQLRPGYYGDLQRWPFHNPARGGLNWSGQGRGCNRLNGWFVVDSVTYTGSTLSTIELRFVQYCDGAAGALRGKVRLTSNDATQPPGPVHPPPATLWSPPAGAVPAIGNVVFLQGEPGDFIVGGNTLLYTDANASLEFSGIGSRLSVSAIAGVTRWNGDFQPMATLTQLQPGYYGDLQRWPFHNPVKGGLNWSGDGRGCNQLTGWFVVDQVVYDSGGLAAISLRFGQRCEGAPPELRGMLRWSR